MFLDNAGVIVNVKGEMKGQFFTKQRLLNKVQQQSCIFCRSVIISYVQNCPQYYLIN